MISAIKMNRRVEIEVVLGHSWSLFKEGVTYPVGEHLPVEVAQQLVENGDADAVEQPQSGGASASQGGGLDVERDA